MTINQFNKPTLKKLRPEIEEALAEFSAKHGITAKVGNASYNAAEATFKISFIAAGADPEKEEFERYASIMDLKPEDYGREFRANGTTYRLVGIKLNRPKYPFIGVQADGTRYKFTESIKRQFGGTK